MVQERGRQQKWLEIQQECGTTFPPAAAAKLLQSCLTLSDPMDCSPPGSSIHGIFQARVLEWVAIAFSRRGPLEEVKSEKAAPMSIRNETLCLYSIVYLKDRSQCCVLVTIKNKIKLKNIFWRRQWHPTPVLLPGKYHGWRNLVGCSPWGH